MMPRATTKVALVVCAAAVTVVAVTPLIKFKTPEPTGVWKDVDEEYYVKFNDDGTYSETVYNLPRPFEVDGDTLTLYNANGQATTADLVMNYGGKLRVLLNGENRVLEPTERKPVLYQWGEEITGSALAAYRLKADFDNDCYLRFYEDNLFSYTLGSDNVAGKYAETLSGDLLLLTRDESSSERLVSWNRGFAMGRLETNITVETVKENAIEDRGLMFRGDIYDAATRTSYQFDGDGFVLRSTDDGTTAQFLYYVDTDGLVTLVDSAGLGVYVYLWYDEITGQTYRYVFERDGWVDFLLTAGGEETSE